MILVSVTDQGSNNYKVDHQLTAEDSEGDVSFLIRVMDLSGNISEDIITTTDGSNVEFDITLPILTNVHIESNNNYSSIAVLGDIATLHLRQTSLYHLRLLLFLVHRLSQQRVMGFILLVIRFQDSDIATGGFLSFCDRFCDCQVIAV